MSHEYFSILLIFQYRANIIKVLVLYMVPPSHDNIALKYSIDLIGNLWLMKAVDNNIDNNIEVC